MDIPTAKAEPEPDAPGVAERRAIDGRANHRGPKWRETYRFATPAEQKGAASEVVEIDGSDLMEEQLRAIHEAEGKGPGASGSDTSRSELRKNRPRRRIR